MASIFRQRKSQFWWIKHRDPQGRIVRRSTHFSARTAQGTREARRLQAELTLAERQQKPDVQSEAWAAWVVSFINLHYPATDRPASNLRCQIAWRHLARFLEEHKVTMPRLLTRAHCMSYFDWRKGAGRNTALLEIKFLGLLMNEAVLRGFALSNPCARLGVQRANIKIKPELTDADLDRIRAAVAADANPARREFFANSLAIASAHGCRLSETYLNPMTDVDLKRGTIYFRAKGRRDHIVPLHPSLQSLFRGLQRAGRTETYARPKSPAKEWWGLMVRSGIKTNKPTACFHSLRVTAASRLARAGVSEALAMQYLGHASSTVHRSYQRWRAEDLSACHAALAGTPDSPEIPDAPHAKPAVAGDRNRPV